MRTLVASLFVLFMAVGLAIRANEKKPPVKLVFESKMGNITFDHATHLKRADGDCKVCHDRIFKQDSKAPLNFKAGMHKPAEASQTSCAFCHHAGGKSFETKGNCNKCHVKAAA